MTFVFVPAMMMLILGAVVGAIGSRARKVDPRSFARQWTAQARVHLRRQPEQIPPAARWIVFGFGLAALVRLIPAIPAIVIVSVVVSGFLWCLGVLAFKKPAVQQPAPPPPPPPVPPYFQRTYEAVEPTVHPSCRKGFGRAGALAIVIGIGLLALIVFSGRDEMVVHIKPAQQITPLNDLSQAFELPASSAAWLEASLTQVECEEDGSSADFGRTNYKSPADHSPPPFRQAEPSRRSQNESAAAPLPHKTSSPRRPEASIFTKDGKRTHVESEARGIFTKDGKRLPKLNGNSQTRKPPSIPKGNLIPASMTIEEIVALPPSGVDGDRYVLEGDPNARTQAEKERFILNRVEKLLANHLYSSFHDSLSDDEWSPPSTHWLQASNILQGLGAAHTVLNVSPTSIEMVYNHHLGSQRTRDLAKGYLGGVLILGGLALLLRIGTGVRPAAVAPPKRA